jgi:hypothetical protein
MLHLHIEHKCWGLGIFSSGRSTGIRTQTKPTAARAFGRPIKRVGRILPVEMDLCVLNGAVALRSALCTARKPLAASDCSGWTAIVSLRGLALSTTSAATTSSTLQMQLAAAVKRLQNGSFQSALRTWCYRSATIVSSGSCLEAQQSVRRGCQPV